MAFKVMPMPVSKDPPLNQWPNPDSNVVFNGGVIYTDLPQKIPLNKSPDMLNLWFKEKALTKRFGQEDFFTGFPTLIWNVYKKYNGFAIIHSGTKLYKGNYTTKEITEIHTGLPTSKGSFFEYRNKLGVSILYYKTNGAYIQCDPSFTVSNVTPYIPKVITGRLWSGGGTVLEQYNLIGAGFINSFSPDGTHTAFSLTQTGLDATTTTCTISGVTKVEGVDYTVNRPAGTVTFTIAPTAGTDTLLFTAYKTSSTSLAIFSSYYLAIAYGGDNNTRVFFAGGTNTYYYSGLLDPTFIPENQYNNVGTSEQVIYNFGVQYNVLVILTDKSLSSVTYTVNSDGSDPRFPLALLNPVFGCNMPWTIQLIGNNLVWCHSEYGFCILNSTNTKDEKNVSALSNSINGTSQSPGLLNNTLADLQKATTYDYWGMLIVCVGSKVWAWDYTISPYVNTGNDYEDALRLSWFPFSNINANCFFDNLGELYYGDRTTGKCAHFINSYEDFGASINAYWEPLLNDFGLFDWTKYIMEVKFSSKTDRYSTITTEYFWDKGTRIDSKIDKVASANLSRLRWDKWTWRILRYALTITKYPKIMDTIFFKCRISNNLAGENLSILDFAIYWMAYRKTK